MNNMNYLPLLFLAQQSHEVATYVAEMPPGGAALPIGLFVIGVIITFLVLWFTYRFGYARACAEAEAYGLGTYVSNDPLAVFKWRCGRCQDRDNAEKS